MKDCRQCHGLMPPKKVGPGANFTIYCSHLCRNKWNLAQGKLRKQTESYKIVRRRRETSDKSKLQRSIDQAHRRAVISMVKLTAGCADCGYDESAVALDFDHLGNDKLKDVSQLITRSWKTIYEEIMKCEVVCANHHRIRTKNRKDQRK